MVEMSSLKSEQQLLPHSTHVHPLTKVDDFGGFICNGCNTYGFGKTYRCASCNYDLHELCATCPPTLKCFLHPEHELKLVFKEPAKTDQDRRRCNICLELAEGLYYQCEACGFDMHPICSQLPEKVSHVPHPAHHLELSDHGASNICIVCHGEIHSWRYKCGPCRLDVHMECVNSSASAPKATQQKSLGPQPLPQPYQYHQPEPYFHPSQYQQPPPQTYFHPSQYQQPPPQTYFHPSQYQQPPPQTYFHPSQYQQPPPQTYFHPSQYQQPPPQTYFHPSQYQQPPPQTYFHPSQYQQPPPQTYFHPSQYQQPPPQTYFHPSQYQQPPPQTYFHLSQYQQPPPQTYFHPYQQPQPYFQPSQCQQPCHNQGWGCTNQGQQQGQQPGRSTGKKMFGILMALTVGVVSNEMSDTVYEAITGSF
ncbi:PREDICTED: involucrin-like [Brassica oleracea var. oleracea]|uniref:involucrin-like n=1 Tax=Brassica oleracea var. oleracea TaxID=109376 RepID=UPI0006A6CBEF|nr:PREDICTED: involucrin-like [Brassica oleracea var. oleracea]